VGGGEGNVVVVEPHAVVVTPEAEVLDWARRVEYAGRKCHQSLPGTDPERFCRMLIRLGHESVMEHVSLTVLFVCDRYTGRQLLRHRLLSFSEMSQRYCKFGEELRVIYPRGAPGGEEDVNLWLQAVERQHREYVRLLGRRWRAEDARSVLPECTATEVVATANLRQWRHVFRERGTERAQQEIRDLVLGVRSWLAARATWAVEGAP
jgi:thymidylate synthase (FAD)